MIIQIFRFNNYIYKTVSENKRWAEAVARATSIKRDAIIKFNSNPSFINLSILPSPTDVENAYSPTNYHCILCEQGIQHSNCTNN